MPYQPYRRRRATALLFLKTLVRRDRPPVEDTQALLDRYPVEVWYLGRAARPGFPLDTGGRPDFKPQ